MAGTLEDRVAAVELAQRSHEDVCSERWRANRASIVRLRRDIERNHKEAALGRKALHAKVDAAVATIVASIAAVDGGNTKVWIRVGCALIAILLGALGYLIDRQITRG